MSRNKTPDEIFHSDKLSARFFQYQKDTSKRGRSLYLSQLLQHIKKEFPEFKGLLDETITSVRLAGTFDDAELEKRILKALRQFATTIEEISEDAEVDWWNTRNTLERMVKEGKIKKEVHPISNNYRDHLYFEIK